MPAPSSPLPTLNACLNGLAAVLLAAGWLMIRGRRVAAHKACMLAAFATSTAFLASYLYYHFQVGSVRYQGTGWTKTLYLAILISHTALATAVAPMALRTLFLAWGGRFTDHTWWARRTLPLWLYVSVTGVVVYAMLYHL